MFDPAIWRTLNPACTIEEEKPLVCETKYRLNKKEKLEQILSLKEDGYCFIPSLVDPKKIDEMMACVQVLLDKGIPPVYAFVYDIFWELVVALQPVLSDFLGRGYLVIPYAWTWRIESEKQGYSLPHRDVVDEDFIDEDGMPTLFSVWIPLVDVSTKSSCIYLLPGSCDPDYPDRALTWREKWKKKGHKPWKVEDLVNIRALPAPKGSFLGWNGGVLHWGSKPHPKALTRISIGYYFHSPKAKKKHEGCVDLKQPFPLHQRLSIILNMMHIHGKMVATALKG